MSASDTPITIANKALSRAITRSSIQAFDDGTAEGYQAGLWYNDVRQRLLRTAPWAFARRQIALTQLGNFAATPPAEVSPYPWGFSYAYPPDAIKFRYVLPPPLPPPPASVAPVVGIPVPFPFFGPSRTNRYIIMNTMDDVGNVQKVLVSNVFQAIGVYTADIDNPALFDPLFTSALEYALAAELSGPLSGNMDLVKVNQALADGMITQARAADANESITTSDSPTDWITTRGSYGFGVGSIYGNQSIGSEWGQWNCQWDGMGWSS